MTSDFARRPLPTAGRAQTKADYQLDAVSGIPTITSRQGITCSRPGYETQMAGHCRLGTRSIRASLNITLRVEIGQRWFTAAEACSSRRFTSVNPPKPPGSKPGVVRKLRREVFNEPTAFRRSRFFQIHTSSNFVIA